MRNIVFLTIACLFIVGCSSKTREVKSPCAGAEGSPCERRPVNDTWLG